MVGQVLAVDLESGAVWVELGNDPPAGALTSGSDLSTRTLDLRPTGRLRASRYVHGRTLGAVIVGGQPAVGDEVVWLAP